MAATRSFETSTLGLTHARTLLAPTTALYALPFGLYYLLLSHRVVAQRHVSNRSLDEGTAPCCPSGICAKSGSGKVGMSTDVEEVDPLFVATRAHANFVENVPMALMLAGLAELNGGDRRVIGGALAGLLMLRIAHVECGMKCKGAKGKGRVVGYFGTQTWLAGMALYGAMLVKDYQGFCSTV